MKREEKGGKRGWVQRKKDKEKEGSKEEKYTEEKE